MKEDLTAGVGITVIRNGNRSFARDRVVTEKPLTIYLNGEELVTLLCTPEKMDRLALGFLRSEGILNSMDEVDSLRLREEEGLAEVELKSGGKDLPEKIYGKRTIASGCGKGTLFFSALDSMRSSPVASQLELKSEQVFALVRSLQEKSTLFKETGGVHSAALAGARGVILFAEDIGRHNAVDKIAGECLLRGLCFDDKILVTSGRTSSEIMLKTAKLGMPVLVSRSAPTSLSVALAEKLKITLVGFVRGKRMNVYTHDWRIT